VVKSSSVAPRGKRSLMSNSKLDLMRSLDAELAEFRRLEIELRGRHSRNTAPRRSFALRRRGGRSRPASSMRQLVTRERFLVSERLCWQSPITNSALHGERNQGRFGSANTGATSRRYERPWRAYRWESYEPKK
jgi:hypothetical protein